MFEDSLIESSGQMRAKKGATVLISTVVHVVLIVVLILIPLISYSELPKAQLMTMLIAPPPPPPPPPPPTQVAPPQPVVIKQVQIDPGTIVQPTEIPKEIARIVEAAPVPTGVQGGVRGGVLTGVLGGVLKAQEEAAPPPPPPPPPPPTAQRVRVGGNVIAANLVSQVKPVYPPLAKQARIQGVVVLEAEISKEGTIENLKVITGHPLLIQAAIDAVKQWRYKPTMLNSEPVPVVTTITVNFAFSQ
jgi:periplasmic protein TonB